VGRKEIHTEFWWGNLKEDYHFCVLGINFRAKFILLLTSGMEDADWIDLAQDGDTLWAVVNRVMNLSV
jgi:hypothetical protein